MPAEGHAFPQCCMFRSACDSVGMYLRDLQPGDLERMYALDLVCFGEPFRFSRAAMRRFALAVEASVRLALASAASDLRQPERETALLGFAIVHRQAAPQGWTGYVATLDVHPAARRQGIAACLMRDLQATAKANGAATMSLHVFVENEAAIRLYERLGYRCHGTVANFYAPGLDALYFELSLDVEGSG